MRIVIVDDDQLIQESLQLILEMEADLEVVGLASNGQEAIAVCHQYRPDLVLMDVRMPVLDGVQATKRIKESFPSIAVIILTTFPDDEYIRQAVLCGAEGYLLKNQSSENIIATIRSVSQGHAVFQKDVAQRLNGMIKEKKSGAIPLELSQRERDVMSQIGQGKSNKEIAQQLYLSEGTVRNYVTGLLNKLGLRDRTQLAIFYLRHME